ncbi:hypothetical protein ACRRTK_003659 [Alexandromys fortis]
MKRADTARDIRNFFPGLIGLEEQKEMQKGLLLNFPNSDEKDTKFHPDTWHTGPQHYTGLPDVTVEEEEEEEERKKERNATETRRLTPEVDHEPTKELGHPDAPQVALGPDRQTDSQPCEGAWTGRRCWRRRRRRGAGLGLGPRRQERHAIGDRAERTDSAPEMQVSPSTVAEPESAALRPGPLELVRDKRQGWRNNYAYFM